MWPRAVSVLGSNVRLPYGEHCLKLNKKIERVPKPCICLGPPYAIDSSHFFHHLWGIISCGIFGCACNDNCGIAYQAHVCGRIGTEGTQIHPLSPGTVMPSFSFWCLVSICLLLFTIYQHCACISSFSSSLYFYFNSHAQN